MSAAIFSNGVSISNGVSKGNGVANGNGVSHAEKALPILSQVNQEITLDDEDRAFWWNILSKPFATLLQANHYTPEVQLSYLRWFYKWIPSALGPRPIDGKPYYGSWLTHDLSPLEYSLNWKEKSGKTTLRFTLEPVNKDSGTAADPINQLAAQKFLNAVSEDVPEVDMTRFNQFLEATNVPEDKVEDAIAKHPPMFPRTRVVVAFDLEHSGKPSPKAYFLPHWRAIQRGISPVTIALDAVRASQGANGASYAPSLAPIDSFLESFEKPEDAPPIFLLSNDCVADTPGSRLKVYFLTAADTLNKVRAMYNLGGRLKGPKIDTSLEKISEFWYFFFGLDPSDPASDDKVCILGPRSVFVYEMRSTQGSEPDVDVKLHLPMWLTGKNDGQIADTLASWFEKHGQQELAARYKSDLLTALYVPYSASTSGPLVFDHVKTKLIFDLLVPSTISRVPVVQGRTPSSPSPTHQRLDFTWLCISVRDSRSLSTELAKLNQTGNPDIFYVVRTEIVEHVAARIRFRIFKVYIRNTRSTLNFLFFFSILTFIYLSIALTTLPYWQHIRFSPRCKVLYYMQYVAQCLSITTFTPQI